MFGFVVDFKNSVTFFHWFYYPIDDVLENILQGEKLKLFYNPAASKLVPNEEFGIGFNGIFSQTVRPLWEWYK